MRLLLISPRIAIQKGDFLGSGIPYWPVELATLAAFLQTRGHDVQVVDLFGAEPRRLEEHGDHYLQGASSEAALSASRVKSAELAVAYALSYMSHLELLGLIGRLRSLSPSLKIAVLENSQAVTAYALPYVAAQFFQAGADALFCGEVYWNWDEIEAWCRSRGAPPCNVLTPESPSSRQIQRLTRKAPSFPIPAWELFNLENYWSLPYAHGPKTKRFLPIISSRGCPFPCDFCVVPETNSGHWRGRSPAEVVEEMLTLQARFGVSDFQFEDLNPTVRTSRFDEIARLLIERRAGVRFYLVSGTKAETLNLDTIPLYARAGCRYISISPESGSSRVMKAVGKPVDYRHCKSVIEVCRRNGIWTQACFILGHPAEGEDDFELSVAYLKDLVRAGLDEAAVFVIAPFAGSKLFQQNRIAMGSRDALVSFSPRGREEYATLERRRRRMIRVFFTEKLKRGWDLWRQGVRALFGEPATKMENLPKRVLFVYYLVLKYRLRRLIGR